jgi:hypothetical protein
MLNWEESTDNLERSLKPMDWEQVDKALGFVWIIMLSDKSIERLSSGRKIYVILV